MDGGLSRRARRRLDAFCERCMPTGETVSPDRYQQIVKRWTDIDREWADVWAGKVVEDADPAAREAELLEEQDSLEFELGECDCGDGGPIGQV